MDVKVELQRAELEAQGTNNPGDRDALLFYRLYNNKNGIFQRRPRKDSKAKFTRRKWIENFVVIKDKRENIHPMRLSPAQRLVEARVLRHERAGVPVRVIILKARQQGVCVAPETRVLTADMRWISADEVHVGDELVSVDEYSPKGKGLSRSLRRAKVEAKVELISDALRVVTDTGEIVVTPGHRLLAKQRGGDYNQWREARDFKAGDRLRMLAEPWSKPDYEDGWMGGMIDGEGHVRGKKLGGCSLGVSQLPGPTYDRVLRYLVSRGYHAADTPNSSGSGLGRNVSAAGIYRIDEIMRLIGTTRPTRFVNGSWWEGRGLPGRRIGAKWATVLRVEKLPPQRVIDLQTSTKTFIAEGIVSHNSTYAAAFALEFTLRSEYGRCMLMAHKEVATAAIFDRIKLMLARMPKKEGTWQISLATANRHAVVIGEPIGSKIYIQSAEGKDPGRADTVPVVHLSESPIWPNAEEKALGVIQIVPDEPGTYVFNEATANGNHGWFHDEFWKAWTAQQQPGWTPTADWSAVFIPWYLDQEYRWSHVHKKPLDTEAAQEIMDSLDDDERELLRTAYVRRGVGRVKVDVDQLAWRRYAIKNKCQGDLNKFHQEFPATAREAFLASGLRFFDQKTISALRQLRKEPEWRGELIDVEAEGRMART